MSNPSPIVPPGPMQRRDSTAPQSAGGAGHAGNTTPSTPTSSRGGASQQDLNQIVIEYLNKKGYSKTEAMLRSEAAYVDTHGNGAIQRIEDHGAKKYAMAFSLLQQWVDENLEIYKPELRRLLWPMFVYTFLTLVSESQPTLARDFFEDKKSLFAKERASEVQLLAGISNREHLETSAVAKKYREDKYRLSISKAAYFNLIQFMEARSRDGGSVLTTLITNHLHINSADRVAGGDDRGFAALLARASGEDDLPEEEEGIPGHNAGSANTDPNAPPVLTRLNLGALPMETDLATDVRDELEEEDAKNPPEPGKNSLVEELDQKIKREPSEEPPNRDNVPLPASLARDVALEVAKIKEYRDRLQIGPRSTGIGPGVSITMFTFHNTFDSINCIDFSGDNALVAVGTAESYVRVWSLEGKPLPSMVQSQNEDSPEVSASRRLIGHSGPIYAVSFAPAAAYEDEDSSSLTTCRFLLSSSGDKTVRLWSLETWQCLVVYKGHTHPIWDVSWGPYGHYFLTGSNDKTARLWSTDQIGPLRIFAGHESDVDCVTWHPNNAYCFSGSSDKTVRMWDVNRGTAVRMFTGHTANITCLSCSPNGKSLASADDGGAIFVWNLATGRRIKRMRGHGRGGIWSMSWNVESSLLVSGGADGTVRVWDALQQTEGGGGATGTQGKTAADKTDGTGTGATSTGTVGPASKKAKVKDATITPDQISAFPTKKSPVYKVAFTRMNLILASGAYMP